MIDVALIRERLALTQDAEYRCWDDWLVGEVEPLLAEVEALREALADVVGQACSDGDVLDSMALSAYADALRLLAERGLVAVESEYGRRVIARWRTP